MSEVLFRRLKSSDVAVVFDEVDNSRWWMLRSIPIIQYLVADDFTYPTSWRQLDGGKQYEYLDFNYHVLGGIESEDLPPLGIVTNIHYEKKTQYSIQPLIDRYTSAKAPLVVVIDDTEFTSEGRPRPLAQEQFANRIGSLEDLFDAMERQYEAAGFMLPLRDTRNIFIQDNAILYELVEGTRLNRTTELFDILVDSPYLPLYDVFAKMFSQEDELGAAPLQSEKEVDGLGKWMRRRVELSRSDGLEIARQLNRAVADDVSTFNLSFTKRNVSVAQAWNVAEDLDANASPVHDRFQTWLTRFQ